MRHCNRDTAALIAFVGGDVLDAIRTTAIFVRAFQLAETTCVRAGSPIVDQGDLESCFVELWQRQPKASDPPSVTEFTKLLSKCACFRFLLEGGECRFVGTGNSPYIPRVKEIVSAVFVGFLHPRRLECAIWEESSAFHGVAFDPLVQLVFKRLSDVTNTELFAETSKKEHKWDEVRQALVRCLEPVNEQLPPKERFLPSIYVDYYLEVLVNLWLIVARQVGKKNQIKEERIAFRSRIAPEYLFVRAFGMSTSVPGLDFLLGGGLLLPVEGASVSISGPPGTGKSSLAVMLALETALMGGVSVLAALETDADIPVRTMVQCRPDEYLQVTHAQTPAGVKGKKPFPISGVLLTPKALRTDRADAFLEDLQAYLAKIPKSWGNRRLLVIDPFNVIRTETDVVNRKHPGDQDISNRPVNLSHRELLNKCLILGKQFGFTTLFVVERRVRDQIGDHELFVVDLVFQTDRDEEDDTVSLAIGKSRYQLAWQGKGAVAFAAGRGMEVFPEAPCLSYAYSDRRSPKKTVGEPYLLQSLEGRCELLQGNWWRSPTVTALVGSRGSSKTALLNTMLAARERNGQRRKVVVNVVLGNEALSPRPQEANRGFHAFKSRYGMQIDNLDADGIDGEVFLVFTLHHIRAEQILWCFVELLRHLRGQDLDIIACSLNDFASLGNTYPLIRRTDEFLSGFVDTCQNFGADAVIACGSDDPAIVHQLSQVAHNIFQLRSARFGGEVVKTLTIQRSLSGQHPDGIFELQLIPTGKCAIASRLRLVNDVAADELHFVDATITLYAETWLQEAYAERVRSTLELQYDGMVTVNVTSPNSQDWSLSTSHILAKRRLRVIQTDAYQVSLQMMHAGCQSPYVDLSRNDRIAGLMATMRGDYADACYTYRCVDDRTKHMRRELPSIPYYLNPSLLMLPANREGWFDSYEEDNRAFGWEWLLKRAIEIKSELGPQSDAVIFGCPLTTSENLNTLFLEILAYYIQRSGDEVGDAESRAQVQLMFQTDARQHASLLSLLHAHEEDVFKATLMVCQLLSDLPPLGSLNRRSMSAYGGISADNNPSLELCDMPPKAIFYRTWYSTAREFLEQNVRVGDALDNDYRLLLLPGKVSTRGDWNLTIPFGSALPDEGIEFISDLCSEEAAWERVRCGVGLPPHKVFYEDKAMRSHVHPATGLTFSKIDELLSSGIRRSVFEDYRTVAPRLAYYIMRFAQRWQSFGYAQSHCYTLNSEVVRPFIHEMIDIWPGLWDGGGG